MKHKMGLIVPYRNREEHLKKFIPHMQKFLVDVPYHLFVIEQSPEKPFNRGKLLNIGFTLAKPTCDYVCFHDVDMLPVLADYSYPSRPTLLATEVEQFNYQLPYPDFFGGVTLFNIADFVKVNGYCNEYWGWGYEDDDLRLRVELAGLEIDYRPGTYLSAEHAVSKPFRQLIEASTKRYTAYREGSLELEEDGLKNLQTEIIQEHLADSYSHYWVKL